MELEKIKEFIDYGKEKIKKDASVTGLLFKNFSHLYYSIFNETAQPCTGCSNDFDSSFNRLSNYYLNKLKNPNYMEEQKSQFKIKGGGVINSVHGDFTDATLTDEVVFHLLKAEPNMIGCFEKESVPKDLEAQMETFFSKAKKKSEAKNEDSAPALKVAPTKVK